MLNQIWSSYSVVDLRQIKTFNAQGFYLNEFKSEIKINQLVSSWYTTFTYNI
jgi:hypothetical protein